MKRDKTIDERNGAEKMLNDLSSRHRAPIAGFVLLLIMYVGIYVLTVMSSRSKGVIPTLPAEKAKTPMKSK